MKLLLLLLVSCAVTNVKVHNNRLNYLSVSEDAKTVASANEIVQELSDEEKEKMIQGYLRFYRFSLKNECNFSEEFLPGAGIQSLKLPPLHYVDFNLQDSSFISKNTFSFMDISTDLKDQKHYYFGQEAQRSSKVFFESQAPPDVLKEGKLHLMLLRSGVGETKTFTMCAIHGTKKNLCVEDKITKKYVDINNKQKFCEWLTTPLVHSNIEREKTLNYLIRVLRVIEVL